MSTEGRLQGWNNVEQSDLEKFKTDLHRTLISKLDLEKLSRVNSTQARQAVAEYGQRDCRQPTCAPEF